MRFRYGPSGERQVAGTVPFRWMDTDEGRVLEVCMVSSRGTSNPDKSPWCLPKVRTGFSTILCALIRWLPLYPCVLQLRREAGKQTRQLKTLPGGRVGRRQGCEDPWSARYSDNIPSVVGRSPREPRADQPSWWLLYLRWRQVFNGG